MFFSTFPIFLQIFNKEYYNLAFLQQFFYTWYFFFFFFEEEEEEEEMEPTFVMHNISIATDDDIIQFGNDVNIYTGIFEMADAR